MKGNPHLVFREAEVDQNRHDELVKMLQDAEDNAESLDAISGEIELLDAKRTGFAPEVMAQAGIVVSLGYDGDERVERGFIKAGDQEQKTVTTAGTGTCDHDQDNQGDEESCKPLSDAVVRDLTAHYTLGLRVALGNNPGIALIAVTHALAAQTFFPVYERATPLQLVPTTASLLPFGRNLQECAAALALGQRHNRWAAQMPESSSGLWDFVAGLSRESTVDLFAHCAAMTVFAVQDQSSRKPASAATVAAIAQAVDLDMTAYWAPTAENFFSRLTKPQILDVIHDAGATEEQEASIKGLKKREMAEAAEGIVAESGWLPSVLRTPQNVS